MTNRTWIIRTTLISGIVALAVYAHGRSDPVVIDDFTRSPMPTKIRYGVTVGWASRRSKIPTTHGLSKKSSRR